MLEHLHTIFMVHSHLLSRDVQFCLPDPHYTTGLFLGLCQIHVLDGFESSSVHLKLGFLAFETCDLRISYPINLRSSFRWNHTFFLDNNLLP